MAEISNKNFDKHNPALSPIHAVGPKSLEEHIKADNFELLQNEENKKLIEKYLTKMGVKEKEDEGNDGILNTYSKTKEKVYQKILEGRLGDDIDNLKGRTDPKSNKNGSLNGSPYKAAGKIIKNQNMPVKQNLTKYFSTTKEDGSGLHKKVSLKDICAAEEKKPDLTSLIKKKKLASATRKLVQNTTLSPKSSEKTFDLHKNSPQKYRKVNLNNDDTRESSGQKMKQLVVQLKRTIELQKTENNKLIKGKKDNEKYIAKLESVLNDEIVKKGSNSKNNININFSSTSLTNNKINNFYEDTRRTEKERKFNQDFSKLLDFYSDSKIFTKRIGDIIKEIENTAHGLKLYIKENYKPGSYVTSKKDGNLMQNFDGKVFILKVNENMENIVRVIKGNYQDFNAKIETKYHSLAGVSIDNERYSTQSQATPKSASKPKNKVREFSNSVTNNNRLISAEKRKIKGFSVKTGLDILKRNSRGSAVTGGASQYLSSNNNIQILTPKSKISSRSTSADRKGNEFKSGNTLNNVSNNLVTPKGNKDNKDNKDNNLEFSKDKIEKAFENHNQNYKDSQNDNQNINKNQAVRSSVADKLKEAAKTSKRLNTVVNSAIEPNLTEEPFRRNQHKNMTISTGNVDVNKLSNIIKLISKKRISSSNVAVVEKESGL